LISIFFLMIQMEDGPFEVNWIKCLYLPITIFLLSQDQLLELS